MGSTEIVTSLLTLLESIGGPDMRLRIIELETHLTDKFSNLMTDCKAGRTGLNSTSSFSYVPLLLERMSDESIDDAGNHSLLARYRLRGG